MAVTDSHTLERLRREESLAEQQGRQALNIALILKNHPRYDAARQKADALMATASALREQICQNRNYINVRRSICCPVIKNWRMRSAFRGLKYRTALPSAERSALRRPSEARKT